MDVTDSTDHTTSQLRHSLWCHCTGGRLQYLCDGYQRHGCQVSARAEPLKRSQEGRRCEVIDYHRSAMELWIGELSAGGEGGVAVLSSLLQPAAMRRCGRLPLGG